MPSEDAVPGERNPIMGLEFTTAKRRKDPIEFSIDGEAFVFTPQKLAGAFLDVVEGGDETGASYDWFLGGLSQEQKQRIVDRLGNPEDDFDLGQLGEIIQALAAQVAGRPTTPSRASRRQR